MLKYDFIKVFGWANFRSLTIWTKTTIGASTLTSLKEPMKKVLRIMTRKFWSLSILVSLTSKILFCRKLFRQSNRSSPDSTKHRVDHQVRPQAQSISSSWWSLPGAEIHPPFLFWPNQFQDNIYHPESKFYSFKRVLCEMGEPYSTRQAQSSLNQWTFRAILAKS